MVRLTNRSSAAKRPSIPQTALGGALKPSHAEQQSVNPEVGVEEGDLEPHTQADTSLAEDSTEKLGLAGSRKKTVASSPSRTFTRPLQQAIIL